MTPRTNALRVLAMVVGVVIVVAALKLGQPVLAPLAAGLFLAVLARPLHRRLRDALPRPVRWLGLLAAVLALTVGVLVFLGALGWSAYAISEELRARAPTIERRIDELRAMADRAGLPLPAAARGAPAASGGSAPTAAADSGARGTGATGGGSTSGDSTGATSSGGGSADGVRGALTRVTSTLVGALGGLALALAFAALGLAEAGEARRRIARLGAGGGARRALDAIDEVAPALRRYVWVKSLTSALTGVATGVLTLLLGLPLPWVWGFLAFLLEFVPTIGSLLAVVPPTLMALAVDGPAHAAVVLLSVGTLQILLGNIVDPRIEGRLMAVSPFGVLLSIVFWGWMWGAVGALLAVPLTVVIVVASRHIEGARGVATLVAGDGVGVAESEDADTASRAKERP